MNVDDYEIYEHSSAWYYWKDCYGKSFDDNSDGYLWSCCGQLGSDEGCMKGRHTLYQDVTVVAGPPST